MGLQLNLYKEKIRYLPKDVSPPGFTVEKVRGGDKVDWLGDVVVNLLKSFCPRLLEERPWVPSEGTGEMECWECLKSLLIGSTTLERMFFL